MADLTTGLVTDPRLEAQPPQLLMRWVAWGSPWRAAGLRVGDRIVAVAGVPCLDAEAAAL